MTKERKLLPIVLDGYKPLRDVVFETLRDAIITQVLKPGERLMEIQLADEMGVSRTPVREAIRKLELEGLVIMVPRKGAYVAGVSMKDIHEVYEVRAALEMLAVSLAAERITDEELDALERQVLQESEAEASEDTAGADSDTFVFLAFLDVPTLLSFAGFEDKVFLSVFGAALASCSCNRHCGT